MAVPEEVPCRLYVILAREAPIAVVFRRGPSKWVQIIKWDTATDTFTPGQWFKGRIYEKRSDLSPNGELLIYAARKVDARTISDKEYTDSWTAISKPPYLTALALWPCRSSVGGGLFLSDTEVWLNHYGQAKPHPKHKPHGLKMNTHGEEILEEVVLDRRLERDGWRQVQEWQGEKNGWHGYVTHAPSIREKRHPRDGLALVMATTLTWFEHQYAYSISGRDGTDMPLDNATWAGWDQQGRLVYVKEGKLFAAVPNEEGLKEGRELADFNAAKHEPMEAPEWAKTW